MPKYKVNQGFITQKIDNKVTIFAGEESVLHTLNETAAYIFQGIKLGWEEKKIVQGLEDKYKATPKQAEKDFKEFIRALISKKIIRKEKG